MFGYRVPEADQAMLVSGGKSSSETPFRVITGHGAFVPPFIRKVSFIRFSMFEASVDEPCVTKQGIQLQVKATIAAKVGKDEASIVNAAQRFLSDQNQMAALTGRIFAGHLRAVVGSMTVEELIKERQRLSEEVLSTSKVEMAQLGLIVDSFQITDITDGNSGYIKAMAAPHQAAIQQAAQIAEANAQQAAAEAQQKSLAAQSGYERDTTMARAGYTAEQAKAQAEADRIAAEAQQQSLAAQADYRAIAEAAQQRAAQAGPLAQAKAAQEVIDEQTRVAERQAALRQQQLVAEVIRPAEAEAQKTSIAAAAEAGRIKTLAEAADTANRIALDQKIIEQLPDLVRAAAGGLSGANLTVLNGADGVGEMLTGIVGQGMAIFNSLSGNLGSHEKSEDTDTSAKSVPQAIGASN